MLRAEWVETQLDLEGPGGAGGGDAAGTQGMRSARRGAEAGDTKIGRRDGSVWGTETTSPFLSCVTGWRTCCRWDHVLREQGGGGEGVPCGCPELRCLLDAQRTCSAGGRCRVLQLRSRCRLETSLGSCSLCVMFRAVGRSQPRLPGAWNYSLSDNSQQCPLPFTLATHIADNGRWRPTRPALALAVSKIFSFDQELHPHLFHVTGNLCTVQQLPSLVTTMLTSLYWKTMGGQRGDSQRHGEKKQTKFSCSSETQVIASPGNKHVVSV